MTHAQGAPDLVTIPLGEAIDHVRAAVAAGDAPQALEDWLFLMNAAGEAFLHCLALTKPDRKGAAQEVINALLAVSALLPPDDDFRPARALVDALVSFVVIAPTGKREHTLFRHNGWSGTWGKGGMRQQHLIGDGLAYVWLLERLGHQKPVQFVAKALTGAGYHITRSTVSSWQWRIADWDIAKAARDQRIEEIKVEGLLDQRTPITGVEQLIRASLAEAVASNASDATDD